MPFVSVIVPAYNAAGTIDQCLKALLDQTYPAECYEVIVVDDGSTDDTVEVASRAGVTVIAEGKHGKSGTRNLGARRASGEYFLFTDADCRPVTDWIAQMTSPFIDDPGVAGVKGAYLSNQCQLVARFTQVEVEERYDRMAQLETINHIDTYAAAYRRDVFLGHGGFDECLPEVEDQELSFRLARQGHKMVFAPEARVYHTHLISARHYFWRKFSIGTWKHLLMNRYPERLVSDSRTPQSLKVQMGFVLMMTVLLPLSLVSRTARRGLAASGAGFIVACLPFLNRARRRDGGVLIIALPMLLLRAAALAYGYINGILRFRWDKNAQK